MSAALPKTTGDLRAFLTQIMVGVRDGTVDLSAADRIAKLAGQITASLTAEAQASLAYHKAGGEVGTLLLGGVTDGEGVDAPQTIEAQPVVKAVPKITAPADKERVFCEQCDRRVTVGEAVNCRSAFCKAKAAA